MAELWGIGSAVHTCHQDPPLLAFSHLNCLHSTHEIASLPPPPCYLTCSDAFTSCGSTPMTLPPLFGGAWNGLWVACCTCYNKDSRTKSHGIGLFFTSLLSLHDLTGIADCMLWTSYLFELLERGLGKSV